MPESTQLAAGELLDGKYVIEELIGRGGMGSVYRARHIRLDSPRAIKLMRAELAEDEAFVLRFENEAMLAEGVRHPNVVALYDFSSLPNGTKYIVWEYVEGESIRDRLDRGITFSDSEVLSIVEQVADGLSAAHQLGILHRDVSPDNIMICTNEESENRAKLLDFGVAKATGYSASAPSTTGMVFGKVGYASPEQMGLLKGNEQLDARADIFSLAAVMFAMLTGEPPFDASSTKNFLHEVMIASEGEVQSRFLARVDERWRGPLSRALARNRDERPPTMEGFASDLRRAVEAPATKPRAAVRYAAPLATVVVGATILTWALTPPDTMEVQPEREVRPVTAGVIDYDVEGNPSPPPPEPDTRGELSEDEPEPQPMSSDEPPPTEPITDDSAFDTDDSVRENPPPNPAPNVPVELGTGQDEAPALDPSELASELPKTPEKEPPAPPEAEEREPAPIPPPKKLLEVAPKYPPIAQRMRIEGFVKLDALITPEGNVEVRKVIESTRGFFEKEAIEAARQWKYEPTIVDGIAVFRETTLTVEFRLR